MANSVRRIETSDLILAIALIVPLFFFVPAADAFNFPKLWIFLILVFGLLVHFLLGMNQEFFNKVKVDKSLGLFLLAFAIVLSWASFSSESTLTRTLFGYPGRSNGLLFYLGILTLLWVSSSSMISSNFLKQLKNTFLALFIIFALYSSIQLLGFDPVEWNNPYNPVIGTLGNPNFSGAFLGVAAAAILHIAILSHKAERIRYLVFGLALLALAISTGSLQAVGIFAIGILITILKLIYVRYSLKLLILTVSSITSISALIFAGFLGLGPLGERLLQFTLQIRLEYWRVGLEIAKEFPLTGIGPDSYVEGFRKFRSEAFVEKYSDQVISDSAHNVLINFMANFGIPAFALLILLIILVSKKALHFLFSKEKPNREIEVLSIVWLLMLIQSLFSLEQIGLSVLQWVCGGLILNQSITESDNADAKGNRQSKVPEAKNFLLGLRSEITILAMLAAAMLTRGFIEQEMEIRKVAETVANTQISKFDSFTLEEAKRILYLNFYLLSAERYNNAEVLLESLLKADPDDHYVREQLARIAAFRGDRGKEIEFRREIEQIDPLNYTNLLSLAEVLDMSGNAAEAKFYAQRVIEITSNGDIEKRAQEILDK
jgi:O-antigen ligase